MVTVWPWPMVYPGSSDLVSCSQELHANPVGHTGLEFLLGQDLKGSQRPCETLQTYHTYQEYAGNAWRCFDKNKSCEERAVGL